ncbi:MAG TPA: hypothetical protein VLL82_01320 [Mycobacterium sp.]|nr:hypothetical protein [Mycobacterium sp.]
MPGPTYSILEVVEQLSASGGGPAPRIARQYRSGDIRHIVADPARAPEVLGFAARVEPRVGLRQWAAS